jgi:hypothetical protein
LRRFAVASTAFALLSLSGCGYHTLGLGMLAIAWV